MMDRPSSNMGALKRDSMQYLWTILLTGGGIIGFVVSVVCSIFVKGVQWQSWSLRASNDTIFATVAWNEPINFMPMLCVDRVGVAISTMGIRRAFRIDRWHGPADSIYAAHRTDNELDLRAGIGSTLAAFISLGGGAPVGQYGPLVHFGAAIGSYLSELLAVDASPQMCLLAVALRQRLRLGFMRRLPGLFLRMRRFCAISHFER